MDDNHTFVRLAGRVELAEIRTATFSGRDHIVVPVVALVGDAVVRPMGSRGPEFVPADRLAAAPMGWSGRPVLPDHPQRRGMPVSANEPDVLEAEAFGYVFHPRYENGRLKVDAYLDPAKAEEIGGLALEVINRAKAGELIEVSVGAYVETLQESGVSPSGQKYSYVWGHIVPDHLAMLPEGAEGACSIDMGCGAPRAARKDPTTEDGKQEAGMSDKKPARALFNRILEAIGIRGGVSEPEGVSDVELRQRITAALHANEPAFDSVLEVFAEDGKAVYLTTPDGEFVMWMIDFELVDGEMKLGEPVEVRPVMRYEPIETEAATEDDPPAAEPKNEEVKGAAACGCGTRVNEGVTAHEKEVTMTDKAKDLVGRLIACERSPYVEEDRIHLEALSEERLEAIAAQFTAEPAVLSDEEWLANGPEEIRALVESHRAEQAKKHDELVSRLAEAQDGFTREALEAKPTSELEALAKALKLDEPAAAPRDFSGRGVPLPPASGVKPKQLEGVAYRGGVPDPYQTAIDRTRSAASKAN